MDAPRDIPYIKLPPGVSDPAWADIDPDWLPDPELMLTKCDKDGVPAMVQAVFRDGDMAVVLMFDGSVQRQAWCEYTGAIEMAAVMDWEITQHYLTPGPHRK